MSSSPSSSPSKWSTASDGQDSFRTAKSDSIRSSQTSKLSKRSAIHDFVSKRGSVEDVREEGITKLLMKMLALYIILLVISSILIITNTINNLPSFTYESRQWLDQNKNELIEYKSIHRYEYHRRSNGTQTREPVDEETLIVDEWEDYVPFTVKLISDMILWVALKYAILIFIALLGLLFTINKFIYGRIIFVVLFVIGNIVLELVFPFKCDTSCTIDVRERRWWQALIRGVRVLSSLVITVVTLIILCVAGIAGIADHFFPPKQRRRTKAPKHSKSVQKVPSVPRLHEPESGPGIGTQEIPIEALPTSAQSHSGGEY